MGERRGKGEDSIYFKQAPRPSTSSSPAPDDQPAQRPVMHERAFPQWSCAWPHVARGQEVPGEGLAYLPFGPGCSRPGSAIR